MTYTPSPGEWTGTPGYTFNWQQSASRHESYDGVKNWRNGSQDMSEKPLYREGLVLNAIIQPKVRATDIARTAGVSRQFISGVLAGREKASPRVIEACRELGLPVDVIWGNP
jgi:hypothetical protein